MVIAGTTNQAVIAFATNERVIANAAIQCIRQITSHQRIRKRIAGDREGLTRHIARHILNTDAGQVDGSAAQQDQIRPCPANRFVAEFIGTPSMNMIEGEIRAEGGMPHFAAPGLHVALPKAPSASGPATLGVRPEDIALVGLETPGAIHAQVTVSELAGAERYHFITMGKSPVILRTPATTILRPGETIALSLDPQRLHLFVGTGEDAAALR